MIFSLSVATILVKVFGLFKELVLSYYYGASNITDAYIIAMTIPSLLYTFIGLAINTSYIPIYMKIKSSMGSNKDINKFTSNLTNCVLIISFSIVLITILLRHQIVSLIAYGFDDSTLKVAARFTAINIISIFFIGTTHIFNGYLQSNNSFIVTALVQVPFHVISILFIVLSSVYSTTLLLVGNVVAVFVQMAILLIFAYRLGFKYMKKIDITDDNIKLTYRLALPLFLGISVNQLNILVDKSIASNITIGGISALNYANKLNLFIYGTIVIAVTTIIFPLISKLISQGKIEEASNETLKAFRFIVFSILPAAVGVMIFSKEIVELIFLRGSFDAVAVKLTSDALFYYSIGLTFVALKEVIVRYFYAMNNTKIPTYNSIVAVFANIALNIVLSRYFGIKGLALATSIAAIISFVLLLNNFLKQSKAKVVKADYIELFKIIVATFIMAIVSKISYLYISEYFGGVSVLIAIFVAVCIYALMAVSFRISEFDEIMKMLKNK